MNAPANDKSNVVTRPRYKPYPAYKDSGVEWLGEIPAHWELGPLFTVVREREVRNVGGQESNVLSLSYGRIIRRDVSDNFGLMPESFDTYQIVEAGNIVLRLTDLQNDKRSLRVGLVGERGIITSAYVALGTTGRLLPEYASSLLHAYDVTKVFYSLGGGARQTMKFEDLKWLPLIIPNEPEQRAIAGFLDRETAKIDALVAKQARLIELLQEKRSALITRAVTKGLDPTVPMKDSGVEWLGEIPAHWEVKRLRHLGEAIIGLTYGPDDVVNEDEGTLVLRASNVNNGRIVYRDNVFVNAAIPEHLRTRLGDILICARSGSRDLIGKNATVDERATGLTFSAFMIVFRSPHNSFLFYAFSSALFEYQSGSFLTSTINQLTLGNLKNMSVPVATPQEQLTIAVFLHKETARIEVLIAKVRDSIEQLKELRTALISAAVTGKIDVREEAA